MRRLRGRPTYNMGGPESGPPMVLSHSTIMHACMMYACIFRHRSQHQIHQYGKANLSNDALGCSDGPLEGFGWPTRSSDGPVGGSDGLLGGSDGALDGSDGPLGGRMAY